MVSLIWSRTEAVSVALWPSASVTRSDTVTMPGSEVSKATDAPLASSWLPSWSRSQSQATMSLPGSLEFEPSSSSGAASSAV